MGRSTSIAPAYDFTAITPGATLYPACRSVWATVAGTITGKAASGNVVTALPVAVGQNNVQMVSITAATATGLFFGY